MPSYLVLARKYRPAVFGDVIGQDHVIQTLKNSIESGRVAHAYLFCGVRGVGKTTVARILAKALNCSERSGENADPCNKCSSCKEITDGISVDVQEIDGASHTSVDNIREINENIKYPPVSSPYKIIIIDEVHMISINAFNALLKTLEEPPAHAKFIFATTESHKVPATINSRCQRFNFRTVAVNDLTSGMAGILKQEGLEADEEALAILAMEAQGSFRDALSLLDQVISFSPDRITVDDVTGILGIAGRDCFARLIAAVLARNGASALGLLHELYQQGFDPEQLVMDLIRFTRNLIVVKTIPARARPEGMVEATPGELEEMEKLAQQASTEELQNLFSMLLHGEGEIKSAGNPWVALEMTIIRLVHAPQIQDLAKIIDRIDSSHWTRYEQEVKPQSRPTAAPSSTVPKNCAENSQSKPMPEESEPRSHSEGPADSAHERFVIEEVRPIPSGAPEEIWSDLKNKIKSGHTDHVLESILDHGSLISYGPSKIEIGFTKALYKEQFQEKLDNHTWLKDILEEFFGQTRIEILTLANATSLNSESPFPEPEDGDTAKKRALKNEAMENPITRAVLEEFEGSSVEEIKIF
jgi:DNA polymerase-3 subunit gamma/tau